MHHHQLLIFFALLIFTFGLFSRFAERKSVTGPMFFMTVGILASPLVFNLFAAKPELDAVTLVAELALTLVLFRADSLIDLIVPAIGHISLAPPKTLGTAYLTAWVRGVGKKGSCPQILRYLRQGCLHQ